MTVDRYVLMNDMGLSYDDLSKLSHQEATRMLRLHKLRKQKEKREKEKARKQSKR